MSNFQGPGDFEGSGQYGQPTPETPEPWYKTYRHALIGVGVSVVLTGAMFSGRGNAEELQAAPSPLPVASVTQSPTPTTTPTEAATTPSATAEAVEVTSQSPTTTTAPAQEPVKTTAPAREQATATAPADEPVRTTAPTQEPIKSNAAATTVSQTQAVKKAEDYLDFMAFSRSGLIEQLEFEGFSAADATFAVDHIHVDWTEQAAAKAQDYLDFMAFSRSGLIEQLMFEGFTLQQAEHGADAVGL